jgi:hypothetical protein
MLGLIALYLTVSLGYMTLYRSQYYTLKDVSVFENLSVMFSQPFVDIFGNSKLSRDFTYTKQTDILLSKSDSKRLPLAFPGVRVEDNNFFAAFSNSQQAAVLKPKSFDGEWKIGYCARDQVGTSICYSSKINASKEQAFQKRKEDFVEVFGISADNKIIELELSQYIEPSKLGSIILL